MSEWTVGTVDSSQGMSDIECHNQTVTGRFLSLLRDKGGEVVVKQKLPWSHEQRDEEDGSVSVWRKATQDEVPAAVVKGMAADQRAGLIEKGGKHFIKSPARKVDPDAVEDLYEDAIYLQFEVLSPYAVKGARCPFSRKLKGIYIVGPREFKIGFEGNMLPGLVQTAKDCGAKPSGFKPKDPNYDPDYLLPYLSSGNLHSPLDKMQILVYVLEPLLQQHAEDGHLVQFHTYESSNFIDYTTFRALDPTETKAAWAQIEKEAEIPGFEESEPEEIPFPSDEMVDEGALKTEIRSLANEVGIDGVEIYKWLQGQGKAPSTTNKVLDQLSAETLAELCEWLESHKEIEL